MAAAVLFSTGGAAIKAISMTPWQIASFRSGIAALALAVFVPDATLAEIDQGKVAAITGTATTSGKGGRTRPIEVTATPADTNHGKLKLCFTTAANREMIFEPAYHFAGNTTTLVLARAAAITP